MRGFPGNSFRVRPKWVCKSLQKKLNKDILDKETFSFCFGRHEVLKVFCSRSFELLVIWKINYFASKTSVYGTSLQQHKWIQNRRHRRRQESRTYYLKVVSLHWMKTQKRQESRSALVTVTICCLKLCLGLKSFLQEGNDFELKVD